MVKIADGIAYIDHDFDDACPAGMVDRADIPVEVIEVLGATHALRINTLVIGLVESSEVSSGPGRIVVSPVVRAAAATLREFLYERVYAPINADPNTQRAKYNVRTLYTYFWRIPSAFPRSTCGCSPPSPRHGWSPILSRR